jgi:IS5 family transposase
VDGLNEALLAKAAGHKLPRTSRLRADTTVAPANVSYPTDSGLLARAIRGIAATGRRIQAAGGARRTRVRDRSRAAGKRAHAIAAKLRSRAAQAKDDKQAAVARATGELAGLAERAARQLLASASAALRRAEAKAAALAAAGLKDAAAGRRRGRLRRAVSDLAGLLKVTRQVAAQARQRLAGTMPDGATRRVSLHDGDARPIAKGRLGKPVEFGYKAQVTDNDDGVILDCTLEQGNPADGPQLAPAIGRVINRTRKKPGTVAADRGYGEQRIEDDLHGLGVRHVVIPRKGKPGNARQATERRAAFRRHVKWRTGSEARIATLKRQYSWDRTRLDGTEGARTWTGHGVLAHNLVKISTLAA